MTADGPGERVEAARFELRVIELSADVQQQFADLAPHLAGVANPVDLGADAPPETIGRAVRALAASAEADALVVTLVATRTNDLPGVLDALSGVAEDQPQLPIVAVVVGGAAPQKLGRGNLPVYDLPEDANNELPAQFVPNTLDSCGHSRVFKVSLFLCT